MRVQTVLALGSEPVYNLTVEGEHEYYANGVLVSNCDAERYVVGWLRDTRDYTLHVAPNPFGVRRESPGPAREHGTRPPTRKRMRI